VGAKGGSAADGEAGRAPRDRVEAHIEVGVEQRWQLRWRDLGWVDPQAAAPGMLERVDEVPDVVTEQRLQLLDERARQAAQRRSLR
jgi:hypothetical protein